MPKLQPQTEASPNRAVQNLSTERSVEGTRIVQIRNRPAWLVSLRSSIHERIENASTQARQTRPGRLRSGPRMYGHVGILRAALRPEIDRDASSGGQTGNRFLRHVRHVRAVSQRRIGWAHA